MNRYAYPGLNRLDESLNATCVLSDDYRKNVMGWALVACTDAHAAGREAERERVRRAFDGIIEPDGFDAATVNEVIKRVFG